MLRTLGSLNIRPTDRIATGVKAAANTWQTRNTGDRKALSSPGNPRTPQRRPITRAKKTGDLKNLRDADQGAFESDVPEPK